MKLKPSRYGGGTPLTQCNVCAHSHQHNIHIHTIFPPQEAVKEATAQAKLAEAEALRAAAQAELDRVNQERVAASLQNENLRLQQELVAEQARVKAQERQAAESEERKASYVAAAAAERARHLEEARYATMLSRAAFAGTLQPLTLPLPPRFTRTAKLQLRMPKSGKP